LRTNESRHAQHQDARPQPKNDFDLTQEMKQVLLHRPCGEFQHYVLKDLDGECMQHTAIANKTVPMI
jgi:hypothetical protein